MIEAPEATMAMTGLVRHRTDTPRAAYTLLPRRVTAATVASLAVVAVLGWAYTIHQADVMSGMGAGIGRVGSGSGMGMAAAVFLGMWAAMMAAMMAPTVAPTVLAYRAALADRGRAAVATTAFALGFLLVWAATGVVAFVPYRVIVALPASAADSRWLSTLGGAVLIAVGVSQFTPWKLRCLRMCRMPSTSIGDQVTSADSGPALRAGMAHGWHCIGCCWALMVVFLVVGVMNLFWMAVIAGIFLVDKHWSHGEGLTRAVGIGLVLLGLAVIVSPDLLAFISGVATTGAAPMATM